MLQPNNMRSWFSWFRLCHPPLLPRRFRSIRERSRLMYLTFGTISVGLEPM
jgi:hypothetical protein